MRAATRLFRAIISLGPRAFRRPYGPDAEGAFTRLVRDHRASRGRFASAWIACLAILDAVRAVLREWGGAPEGSRFGGAGGDFRLALRLFARQPAHAAAVILTFGITVGALTAAFAFVDPILFRPLSLPDADRVVVAHAVDARSTYNRLRAADYARVREAARSLESVSSYYGIGFGRSPATRRARCAP